LTGDYMEALLKGKKFIASYSCGKDSTLAVYRAIKQGMVPVELFTTYNLDRKQSWFHGIPEKLLNNISKESPLNAIIHTL